MSVWDELIAESRKLEDVASKIQNGESVGLSEEKIRELVEKFHQWYAECMSVLPDNRKDEFSKEYKGKMLFPKIREFLEDPTSPNAFTVSIEKEKRDASFPYWSNPYKKSFLNPLLRQRQILFEVKASNPEAEQPMPSTSSQEDQLRTLLGYMYRKPLEPRKEDIDTGINSWTQHLTQKQEHGEKLEVALLNALSRLNVPSFFTGSASSGGPETPVFDLVALGFFTRNTPTAILISCKSKNQPNLGEIGKLSDEAARVGLLLPDWLVFGTLAVPEEPTAQDFSYRQDIRIWKKSHLQMILHAHERKHIDMLLWTPPRHWNSDIESAWLSMYNAYHRDVFKQ